MPANSISIVEVASNSSGVDVVEVGSDSGIQIVQINQGPAGAASTVDQTIIDGSTNAVAGNAVFDALALKAPLANPTFTGTVSGITKSMVGLGNVDNTSDANKPVSTAQQTALNLKANLASPTFTGIVTAPRITGRCDGLEVLCKAGLAIAAGQVVYVTGASGNNIVIGLARANSEATSSKTIGISESTLAQNATGYVITEGLMTVSISAPTAVEGDPIWLSPATAGSMVFGVANKPSSPNHIVYLGVVTRKTGNTVVEIYVKVQNGAELDELSDVAITSAVAGQALMRGATAWENRNLVSADISNATSAATANTLALRDATGGANFAAVGASSITSSGAISTNGAVGSISTYGGSATIFTKGTFASIYTEGDIARIFTQGDNASIGTIGSDASIYTQGDNASIYTSGAFASIYTGGANAYIQSRSTFNLYNGTYTTTLSHAPTDNRAIAFPDKAGTVAMVDAETHTGAHAFSSTTRPTSAGTGTPAATSLITLSDVSNYSHFSRNLFSSIVLTASGVGATVRRITVASGVFDGDLSTLSVNGSYIRTQISSSSLDNYHDGASAVSFSRPWTLFTKIALNLTANTQFHLGVGVDATTGIPSSGTNIGFQFTANNSVRLWRCNGGAATFSTAGAVSNLPVSYPYTGFHYIWLECVGNGTINLYIDYAAFGSGPKIKPTTALCTLTGVGASASARVISSFLYATGTPGGFTSNAIGDCRFLEF